MGKKWYNIFIILDYLPSKNFIAIVGSLAVVLFTGWFAFSVIPNSKNQASSFKLQVEREITLADAYRQADLDTDGDGLKDWEEILWGTNPKKGDTDGDGTVDGREVKDGRDPLTAGTQLATSGKWSDELKKPEEIAVYQLGATSTIPTTFTADLASDFITDYFGTKGLILGRALPEVVKKEINKSLFVRVQKATAAYKDTYNKEDINISSSVLARNYLNELGETMDNIFKDINDTEMAVIISISESKDFSELEKLNTYIEAYENIISFLKEDEVPEKYANLHLSLLNSMQNTLLAVENMKKIENDPATGLVGLQLYSKEVGRGRAFLETLKIQVLRDGIVFEKEEGGAFFNQYFAQL